MIVLTFEERDRINDDLSKAIIDTIHRSPIDNIYIPDMLSKVLFEFDKGLDHLYYEWLACHYFKLYIPDIVENIKIIHQHLIKNKHTFKNRGGHGSGDSYVYYIPDRDKIVQCYEDQNIKFICMYWEYKPYYDLHIRRFWDRDSSKLYVHKPTLKMFRNLLKNDTIGKKFPMRYKDSRDPGYILTYDKFFNKVDGASYHSDLIKHAFFNINSQKDYFDTI
jgi:hypothetical protein